MSARTTIAARAEELLGVAVVSTAPVAGGDISVATRLRLNDGTTALMKTLPQAPEGFFEAEAEGLRWLAEASQAGGVPVPEVLAVDARCLIVRWVEPGKTQAETAADFGRRLAITHAMGAPEWGAQSDGFIGKLPLPNRTSPTWPEFYAVRRVLPYLKLASDRHAIELDDVAAIEAIIGKLPDLIPDDTPSRVHGDLWNGNCLWGLDGHVHVIDPAAYGGHRELDLAMLALFGLPHLQQVMAAYVDHTPLVEGWEDRLAVHQLHPLLVHACMFGGRYGARAAELARRFG